MGKAGPGTLGLVLVPPVIMPKIYRPSGVQPLMVNYLGWAHQSLLLYCTLEFFAILATSLAEEIGCIKLSSYTNLII